MSEGRYQFDVVIVGAGPAGLAAACAAAESGQRVAVVDNTPWLGGQIWRGQEARPTVARAQYWLEKFRQSGATLLAQTTVIAAPEKYLLLAETPQGACEIGWQKLILATGARELFLPFPGWTLPGVTGPGGLQVLAKQGWPVAGKRVVIAGTGPLLLAVADGLKQRGATIVCIAEQAPFSRVAGFGLKLLRYPGKLCQGLGVKFRLAGVPYLGGTWVTQAQGDEQVRHVELTDGKRRWREACDVLACGFNLVPNVELPLALDCELADGFVWVDQWQRTGVRDVYCAGEPTGISGVEGALVEGQIAGYAASGARELARPLLPQRNRWHKFQAVLAEAFALRSELKALATDETLLCRCEDVACGRVRQFPGWRPAKLQTRCGMGACQGRTCGAAAKFLFGWGLESVRPPVLPARLNSLITTIKQHE